MTPEDDAAVGAIEHFEAHGLTEYAWAVRKVLDERDELRTRLEHPCDGTDCEGGGAAHCHACPEAEANRLLAERDELRRELDEITDLDRTALKTQELRDERSRAVRMWHDEKRRADQAEADRDAARAQVADYENRIIWHTTCGQCATVLDRAIAETERAEKAEAERDQARQIARALRTCYLTGDAAGLATTPDWLTEEMT